MTNTETKLADALRELLDSHDHAVECDYADQRAADEREAAARVAAREKAATQEHGLYLPSITLGTLVGYAATTVVPIANLFAAIFDVAPAMFRSFFDWCARVLDFPLVPKRSK